MKKSIWKFPFKIEDDFVLEMPCYAKLLHVAMQGGRFDIADQPCIWALVDVEAPKVKRKFALRGTGHDCDDLWGAEFVGTFFVHPDGSLVFHLFNWE
jgi:hypothetical protein